MLLGVIQSTHFHFCANSSFIWIKDQTAMHYCPFEDHKAHSERRNPSHHQVLHSQWRNPSHHQVPVVLWKVIFWYQKDLKLGIYKKKPVKAEQETECVTENHNCCNHPLQWFRDYSSIKNIRAAVALVAEKRMVHDFFYYGINTANQIGD